MATLASIDSSIWDISTIGYGVIVEGLAAIRQRIDIAIRTTKGSDPLRPEFGSYVYEYIDMPLDVAVPNIKSEIITALQMWVPEITVTSITHSFKSDSNPVFSITYQVSDQSITDNLLFEIQQGQTTVSNSSTEILLQAFFPSNPNNYRYQISLIRNSVEVNPTPPDAGFATLQDLFNWIQANWFFWGRWYMLSDRIICYMSSDGVSNATLAISVLAIVRISAIFPPLNLGQFYNIAFTVGGQPASPPMPLTFFTPSDVLGWVQNNWAQYGTWSVEGVLANDDTEFSDEFSLEFDSPLPDTFSLILTSDIADFTGNLLIITT